jgi:hypothetical protein
VLAARALGFAITAAAVATPELISYCLANPMACNKVGLSLVEAGGVGGAASIGYGKIASKIGSGHGFAKHIDELAELGVKTEPQYMKLIENVMKRPTMSGNLERGRAYFYDGINRIIVIYNPNAPDYGTAFKIDPVKFPNPMSYINTLE